MGDRFKKIDQEVEHCRELATKTNELKDKTISEPVITTLNQLIKQMTVPRTIHIKQGTTIITKLDGELFHKKFETIYKLVRQKIPTMLIGPSGSGKNYTIEQVANALELLTYYENNANEEYKIVGFVDANGNYKETQFYKAFKDDGVFFLDEMDNSHPSALLILNSAIGTGKKWLYDFS